MSRWGKSGIQKFALPLDALVKEKENTNRPIAARSAGTVGKWGITSFTSIRGTNYEGFSSFSPKQDGSNANISPHSSDYQTTSKPSADLPKPKKFFKSRNVAPDFNAQQIAFSEQQQQSPTTPKLSLKINKKLFKNDDTKKQKHEKIKTKEKLKEKDKSKEKEKLKEKGKEKLKEKVKEKVKKKPKLKEEKKVKNEEPTRVLSRTRKSVNYYEDNSRSPTPVRYDTPSQGEAEEEPMDIVEPEPVIKIPSTPVAVSKKLTPPQSSSEPPAVVNIENAPENLSTCASSNKPHDHPPIVLRISKGTSRLISTDSEEVHSPPYVSPKLNNTPPGGSTLTSTAELLAVLSDEQLASVPPQAPAKEEDEPIKEDTLPLEKKTEIKEAEPVVSEIKPEGIKIKIKKLAKAFIASNNSHDRTTNVKNKFGNVDNGGIKRSLRQRARKTTKEPLFTKKQLSKMGSPQPGSENYELYRTLAASPSDKDFDSQSSILGSISSNFAADAPEDCRVIHSRGSSDITSDQDTSQDSSLVAPPSEMDLRLAAMMEGEQDAQQQTEPLPQQPVELPKKEETVQVEPIKECKEKKPASPKVEKEHPKSPKVPIIEGRVTRNKNGLTQKTESERPPLTRSYGRKRKPTIATSDKNVNNQQSTTDSSAKNEQNSKISNEPNQSTGISNNQNLSEKLSAATSVAATDNETEYKINNKKLRKSTINQNQELEDNFQMDTEQQEHHHNTNSENINNNTENMSADDKPSVKLVISKKKGSIFKSRAIDADAGSNKKPKRHLYKHKWDDNSKEKVSPSDSPEKTNAFKQYDAEEFDDGETSAGYTRVTRQRLTPDEDDEEITSVKCNTKAKKFYTVVRNVKKAHQIQEIGEFQEMDDDIEYILDALQPHNKMSTRCLSAIQLASKCMTPAFRMHVRAHGTITKFFKSLIDAAKDQSLGLCTATVMFVLNQDNLNMDLDRDSLELMLNLLESDVSHKNALDDCGLTRDQLQRNKQKVKELCTEIKNQGKAVHLNLDNITVGTLAMETLLSLTSKRAGEWFKEELRKLGGLEHIIKTICECCKQISDYVVDWTEVLLEKLRKIERCLRVLENVSQENEENQNYILSYENGQAIETFLKFYKLCDSEIALYPTTEQTPKENPGVVLREALVPTIKVLINLTHPFNTNAYGSKILGQKPMIFDTSLHLLLQAHNYVPESCIFDISILVLLLLINLTMYTVPNRNIIMEANAPTDFGNQFIKVSAVKALIEYFYKCEELARLVEKKTDDMLDNPKKLDGKNQEEVDETVTKLLQKAGHHMEHTMLASYVCLLIGHLIMDSDKHQAKIRTYLKNGQFAEMVQILEKYYNFMNLTASSASATVEHIKQTKMIIEYLKKSDLHSNDADMSNSSNANRNENCMTTSNTSSNLRSYKSR